VNANSESETGATTAEEIQLLRGMPLAPDMVLRIGFAGNRRLPENTAPLRQSLASVLSVLSHRLQEIAKDRSGPDTSHVSLFTRKRT